MLEPGSLNSEKKRTTSGACGAPFGGEDRGGLRVVGEEGSRFRVQGLGVLGLGV